MLLQNFVILGWITAKFENIVTYYHWLYLNRDRYDLHHHEFLYTAPLKRCNQTVKSNLFREVLIETLRLISYTTNSGRNNFAHFLLSHGDHPHWIPHKIIPLTAYVEFHCLHPPTEFHLSTDREGYPEYENKMKDKRRGSEPQYVWLLVVSKRAPGRRYSLTAVPQW